MRKISVDEYEQMIERGILKSGEPYELLDGFIVLKDRSAKGEGPTTVGLDHAWAVRRLARLDSKLQKLGCCIQTQLPVVLSDFSEPEPDAAIMIGTEDDYKKAKPTAAQVSCVLEVADGSLQHDRPAKLADYARSNIPSTSSLIWLIVWWKSTLRRIPPPGVTLRCKPSSCGRRWN